MNLRRAIFLLSILSMSIFTATGSGQSKVKNLQLGGPLPTVAPRATAKPTSPPPAFAQPHAPRKPIPLQWKLAIVAGTLIVSLGVLRFASRAWRKWNLFDRQYRFPVQENVAPRLGGTRSGGCTATIDFRRDSVGEDA